MEFTLKKNGFTLVELVMVIIIIAVLAAIGLPKFINLQSIAKNNSDNYIISSLQAAIKNKYLENLANGISPYDAWYLENDFFTLLKETPPYTIETEPWGENTQDNVHWRIYDAGVTVYIICPHCNCGLNSSELYIEFPYPPKGKVWRLYRENMVPQKGDIIIWYDYPH